MQNAGFQILTNKIMKTASLIIIMLVMFLFSSCNDDVENMEVKGIPKKPDTEIVDKKSDTDDEDPDTKSNEGQTGG